MSVNELPQINKPIVQPDFTDTERKPHLNKQHCSLSISFIKERTGDKGCSVDSGKDIG